MIKFPCEPIDSKKFLAHTEKYKAEFLLKLYFDMWRIRLVEEEIENHYSENKMKTPVHLSIGQEAGAVGCNNALQYDDLIYCSHRTHGHYLAKGGDLKAMLAELHCRKTGCAKSLAGSMHLLDKKVGMEGSSAIVAGAIPIAAGFALKQKMNQLTTVSAVFFGDAATEEGVHWETLNFAILKKLPIIFVCENNFYSVCTPLEERQPSHVKIIDRVAHFGLPAYVVNGNDVLSVYDYMSRAVQQARNGKGPSYLVINSYRWRSHHGAGDDSKTGYRAVEELNSWMKYDPIKILRHALLVRKILTLAMEKDYKNTIQIEIATSFSFALNSAYPSQEILFDTIYA